MTRYFCNYCDKELTDVNKIHSVSGYLKPATVKDFSACDEVQVHVSACVVKSYRNDYQLTDTDICFPCLLSVMKDVIEEHTPKPMDAKKV